MSVCIEDIKTDEILHRVKKVISNVLKISEDQINMESRLVEDFGADSLERVSLVVQFEFEFDREIPEEDAEKLRTVGDIVEYILNAIRQAN